MVDNNVMNGPTNPNYKYLLDNNQSIINYTDKPNNSKVGQLSTKQINRTTNIFRNDTPVDKKEDEDYYSNKDVFLVKYFRFRCRCQKVKILVPIILFLLTIHILWNSFIGRKIPMLQIRRMNKLCKNYLDQTVYRTQINRNKLKSDPNYICISLIKYICN